MNRNSKKHKTPKSNRHCNISLFSYCTCRERNICHHYYW